MADNGFVERLRRVERVVAGEEEITQKQAMILNLDLIHTVYLMTKGLEENVAPKSELRTLKVRVGILFSLVFLIIGAVALGG